MLTMLSTLLVSNMFAKYVNIDAYLEAAHVANGGSIELCEHEAELKNGIYVLDESVETTLNTYKKVIPGVDIAKDPFIRLDLENAEVDYELYLQVTESTYFPETVTYKLTDDWVEFDKVKGIYKYEYTFDAATSYDEIQILKGNKLYVSEHYVGKDTNGNDLEFSLTFNAWMKQID